MEKLSTPPIPSKTFVETDAKSFKEIVQRLTGPGADTSEPTSLAPQAPSLKAPAVKRPKFKIQERRQGLRSKLTITRPNSTSMLSGLISPSSALISPSRVFSGLTLTDNESSTDMNLEFDKKAEEKAIKEKRFYLHPSPRSLNSLKNAEPELLTLFPLSSPKTIEP